MHALTLSIGGGLFQTACRKVIMMDSIKWLRTGGQSSVYLPYKCVKLNIMEVLFSEILKLKFDDKSAIYKAELILYF